MLFNIYYSLCTFYILYYIYIIFFKFFDILFMYYMLDLLFFTYIISYHVILYYINSYFSRMRSKGSRFTLGVWGLRVCSLDVAFVVATVRNRPQPFATVRVRTVYGKFCRGGPFWRFQTSGCFVSRGRRGTLWHSDVFWNVSKVVLRGRRTILLWRFQKMCCSFRGRRSTLDVSIVIFRGRRSTLDVSCCVFFANRIGSAASSGDKVQIPWQSWHFVRRAENSRKPRTKHRFWGCKFSGSKEQSRIT